tara:strand:- start:532 stop:1167 length:636 start_codon:yes stop_codon:yes gene_type:complete
LAKRLSKKEKEVLVEYFSKGLTIDKLADEFECTKLTISRNLKKIIGEVKYRKLIDENKKNVQNYNSKVNNNFDLVKRNKDSAFHEEYSEVQTFTEIIPLDYEIENSPQKDLASIPISEIDLPNIVYMIVDKKIELEIRYLKDYPEWKFLSKEELDRKTIEIYLDLKIAKRFCNKEQKVIKVPNTNVFKIVAPILLERGISRIISEDKLIAL